VSLEEALAKTETDADAALKTAAAAIKSLKRVRSAAQAGNLRDLGPTIEAAELAIEALRRQVATARAGWDFDEEAYFGNGLFTRELVETARRMNVRIFEEDDRLYCYPALIRVQPGDRSVLIDKARERRLRPTVLVRILKDLQERPARFRPEVFLQSIFDAYAILVAKYGKQALDGRRVERLLEIYELLTLLPGQAKEYTRQEFGRDLYLLDRSGVTTTRKGYAASFHASTSTKPGGSTIRVITEDGRDKLYYGISFTPVE
jgi:hypothetical protein